MLSLLRTVSIKEIVELDPPAVLMVCKTGTVILNRTTSIELSVFACKDTMKIEYFFIHCQKCA